MLLWTDSTWNAETIKFLSDSSEWNWNCIFWSVGCSLCTLSERKVCCCCNNRNSKLLCTLFMILENWYHMYGPLRNVSLLSKVIWLKREMRDYSSLSRNSRGTMMEWVGKLVLVIVNIGQNRSSFLRIGKYISGIGKCNSKWSLC